MTTLNDVNLLRKIADHAAERYNRRCRRLVALYRAGRKVNSRHWDNTDFMKMMMESTRQDLEMVIENQALAASV